LLLTQQDSPGYGLKSGDLKIIWRCGKTLKLDINLTLLVWLTVGNPNYSKGWLKDTLENNSKALFS
jgi:hypothetical protein